jgi:hypothetical protein
MDLNGPLENMNTTEIEKIFEVIEYVSQLDVSQTQNLLKEINEFQPLLLHSFLAFSKELGPENQEFLTSTLLQIWTFYKSYPSILICKMDRNLYELFLKKNHEKIVEIEINIKNLQEGENIKIGIEEVNNKMLLNIFLFIFSNSPQHKKLEVEVQSGFLLMLKSLIQTLDSTIQS